MPDLTAFLSWLDDKGRRHNKTLTLHPPHPDEVAAYAYFGLEPPGVRTSTSRTEAKAMRHPWVDRKWHRRYATRHGYFWMPCPRCGREFGGHEVSGDIPDPKYPDVTNRYVSVCALCAHAKPEEDVSA